MTTLRWSRRCLFAVATLLSVGACSHAAVTPPATAPAPLIAPDSFDVSLETSRGPVLMRLHRAWAPLGVDRFYGLVQQRYYDESRVYRMVHGFVAQFGLAADPRINALVKNSMIADDPIRGSNQRGTVSFASAGPGTRTAQLFINLVDNVRLDTTNGGYPPIGQVLTGMNYVDQFYAGYEGTMPRGVQDSIVKQGNAYLIRAWPRLDYIQTARVVREYRP